jgi:hypothetical protein
VIILTQFWESYFINFNILPNIYLSGLAPYMAEFIGYYDYGFCHVPVAVICGHKVLETNYNTSGIYRLSKKGMT